MQFPDIIFYYLLKQFKQKGSVKLKDFIKTVEKTQFVVRFD